MLEGNPTLRVEPYSSSRLAHRLDGTVDAPDPGSRELSGKEKDRVAVPAAGDKGAFGRGNLQRGGRKRCQRGSAHEIDDRNCRGSEIL